MEVIKKESYDMLQQCYVLEFFAYTSNYVTINEQHKPHSKIGSGVIYMQIKNSHH